MPSVFTEPLQQISAVPLLTPIVLIGVAVVVLNAMLRLDRRVFIPKAESIIW